jgi:hypothetical protein
VGAQSLTGGQYTVNSKNSRIFLQIYKGFDKFEWGPMPPLSSSWVNMTSSLGSTDRNDLIKRLDWIKI